MIVNCGDTVAPAGTVTDAGTVVLGSVLLSVISAPPAGAGPVSVNVFALVELPPEVELGDNVMPAAPTVPIVAAVTTFTVGECPEMLPAAS